MQKDDLVYRNDLLAAYDAAHKGPPGGARKLMEEAPGVDCWINVKDRLPEDEYECLVITKDGWYRIGWFCESIHQWVADGIVWCDGTITHWIKLPEPPKEDEDDAEQ